MSGSRKDAALPRPVEPKDPVAYPRYPKRIEGARRPVYEPVGESTSVKQTATKVSGR